MSQKSKRVSNNQPPASQTPSNNSTVGRRKRQLPQIPVTTAMSTPVAKGNDTTINLTTVSDISTVTDVSMVTVLTQSTTSGDGKIREFVSPVKFTDSGEDSCVTVAVRVRPFSER